MTKFWLQDPFVLLRNDNYVHFLPTDAMDRTEQLNALSLFCIYFFILAQLTDREQTIKRIPIIGLFLIIVLYYSYRADPKRHAKDDQKREQRRKEKQQLEQKEEQKEEQMIHHDPELEEGFDFGITDVKEEPAHEVEVGQYDSDGKIQFIKDQGVPEYEQNPERYPGLTKEQVKEYQTQTCRRPTEDNPFMNPTVTDYGNGPIPAACNAGDDRISDETHKMFTKDLYRDVSDLWERQTSERQMYTIPATGIPNDQKLFAEWCYRTPETCKENQENCLQYEDLRFKRGGGTTHIR